MARQPAKSSTRTQKAAVTAELGVSGLRQSAGIVREEFLRELQGRRGAQTYREMRWNDPVVGAVLFAIEMLLRGVEWRVDSKTAGLSEDDDAAEFVAGALMGDLDKSWPDTLAEILSFLPFGWALTEIVYKRRQGQRTKQPSVFDDGRIGWDGFALRAQETLDKWEFDDAGRPVAMHQRALHRAERYTIPLEKALLFRTSTHKNSPEGRSILRTAYRPWYFKKRIESIEGIGIERDLAGLPVMYVPAEWTQSTASSTDQALFTEAKNIVRNIRRDEQEGIILPTVYDKDGKDLLKLELLSTGGRRQFDTSRIIERYDSRIAMTVLADFILLGHQKVGSFALSSDKTNLFGVAIGAWLDMIAAQFNRKAIPDLLRLNGMAGQCELMHGDIEAVDFAALADSINKLVGAGVLMPDDGLEQHLREVGNLPGAETGREDTPEIQPGSDMPAGMDGGEI